MKPLYRNVFLIFGLVALGVMIWSFPDGWNVVRQRSENVMIYLPAILGVWAVIYGLYSWAFQILVNGSDHDKHLSYPQAYKLTLSAFSFTAITPFGFGGGPYRVMELAKYIGTPRAISSTALYSMMHIFSHFILWATGCIVFLAFYLDKMTPLLWTLIPVYLVLFVAVALFFNYSYKHGILCRLFQLFFYVPWLKGPCRRFYEKNYDGFQTTDANIRYLYEHPRQLWGSLVVECAGRVLSAFEYWFILLAFGIPGASFADAFLILCFSSLIGNVLYVLPLQIGAREGSLAIIMHTLFGASAGIGIYVSIFTRIREIFWVVLGVLLVKVGYKRIMK